MSPCPECLDHLANEPRIIGACASVGIERKRSTPEMVRSYMAGIHRRDNHKENR